MPGGLPGGGGMLKLRFDWYISSALCDWYTFLPRSVPSSYLFVCSLIGSLACILSVLFVFGHSFIYNPTTTLFILDQVRTQVLLHQSLSIIPNWESIVTRLILNCRIQGISNRKKNQGQFYSSTCTLSAILIYQVFSLERDQVSKCDPDKTEEYPGDIPHYHTQIRN